jgi:undecaprenyl-diphosphatase
VYQAIKRLRRPEDRRRLAAWLERQGEKPALRPLAAVLRPLWRLAFRPAWRVARPPLRFVGGRLTPGGLGIEFTTLLAIAAVSIYVIVLQIDLINGDELLAGDRWALDAARDMQTAILTSIAKVLSFLGRAWFVSLIVAAAVAFLAAARRRGEGVTLVAGFLTAEIATQVMKSAVDRPRPSGGLVHATNWSYPSGHAAIAVTYLALAVLFTRGRRASRGVAIVAAGFVLALLIGLSRVYLRVHYLSDVVGGWAVGLTAFSLCGAVALVVHYLRNSLRARERSPRAGHPQSG